MNDKEELALRLECRQVAWRCCATAYIFQERMKLYRRRLQTLNFLGIAVPAAVGGVALSAGPLDGKWFGMFVSVAGGILVIQLVLSVLSLTNKWDDAYAYATKSAAANTRLRHQFERLGRDGSSELQQRFNELNDEDMRLHEDDEAQGLSLDERRMGHRFSLKQYDKACKKCEKIPDNMETDSDCGTCGSFKEKRF
jgi:mobilome CxxCx(11)CxxC protein